MNVLVQLPKKALKVTQTGLITPDFEHYETDGGKLGMKPIFEKWENWGTILTTPINSPNKLEKGDQVHFRNNVKLEPVDEENGVFTINEMQIAYYIRPEEVNTATTYTATSTTTLHI